jgi:uncharacterized integral membrane protein
VLLLALIVFTAQNYAVVKIKFLFWSFQTSRAIMIFAAVFTGIIIGWILSRIVRLK